MTGLLSWLIQGARNGRGVWPFNLYRWGGR